MLNEDLMLFIHSLFNRIGIAKEALVRKFLNIQRKRRIETFFSFFVYRETHQLDQVCLEKKYIVQPASLKQEKFKQLFKIQIKHFRN